MNSSVFKIADLIRLYTDIPEEYVQDTASALYDELTPVARGTPLELQSKLDELDKSLPNAFKEACARLILEETKDGVDASSVHPEPVDGAPTTYREHYAAVTRAIDEEHKLCLNFDHPTFNGVFSTGRLSARAPLADALNKPALAPLCTQPRLDKVNHDNTSHRPRSKGASLPITSCEQQILHLLEQHDVLIVTAETGSGKSSQLPQMVLSHWGSSVSMLITQPRRVPATSLAGYVDRCLCKEFGHGIAAYSVRFGSTVTERTQLTYATEGVLLRVLLDASKAAYDQSAVAPGGKNTAYEGFFPYNVIMLDEVHEKTATMCILLFLLSSMRRIKLILCSATAETEALRAYMEGSGRTVASVHVPGCAFPVREVYYEDIFPQKYSPHDREPVGLHNFVECCVELLTHLLDRHLASTPIDAALPSYLVLLPGRREIFTVATALETRYINTPSGSHIPKLHLLTCYSGSSDEKIQSVFERGPSGSMKVILATNIAETSITIPDVTAVVDSGYCKQMVMTEIGHHSLALRRISQSQAVQRKGRAGRLREGVVYRVYSRNTYESLDPHTCPEIARCDLAPYALSLLAIGYKLEECRFINCPPLEAMVSAYTYLYSIGSILNDRQLTPMGVRLATIPESPRLGAVLLEATNRGVLVPCAMISAALSVLQNEHSFTDSDRDDHSGRRANHWTRASSDHLVLLEILRQYTEMGRKDPNVRAVWVKKHSIRERKLQEALALADRYTTLLALSSPEKQMNSATNNEDHNANSILIPFIKTGLHGVLKRNSGIVGTTYSRLDRPDDSEDIRIHPASVLYGCSHAFIFCEKIIRTDTDYACICSPVSGKTLLDLFPHMLTRRCRQEREPEQSLKKDTRRGIRR